MEHPVDNALVRLTATFEEHTLTVVTIGNQPYWLARQVGAGLGYADDGRRFVAQVTTDWSEELVEGTDFTKLLGEDLATVKRALGPDIIDARTPSLLLLTESGVFGAALLSRQPAAARLRRWLSTEVLPQIVRTGTYASAEPPASKRGRQKALAGPLPVPRGPWTGVLELSQAINAGLDAYEALDPALRRRGELSKAIRFLDMGQSLWFLEQVAAKNDKQPPEFRYTGAEGQQHAAKFEAWAQVNWLIDRMPDASLPGLLLLVEQARQRPPTPDDHEWREFIAELRLLPAGVRASLGFVLRTARSDRDVLRDAVTLLADLVERGPKAVVQARQWCTRLWAIEDR